MKKSKHKSIKNILFPIYVIVIFSIIIFMAIYIPKRNNNTDSESPQTEVSTPANGTGSSNINPGEDSGTAPSEEGGGENNSGGDSGEGGGEVGGNSGNQEGGNAGDGGEEGEGENTNPSDSEATVNILCKTSYAISQNEKIVFEENFYESTGSIVLETSAGSSFNNLTFSATSTGAHYINFVSNGNTVATIQITVSDSNAKTFEFAKSENLNLSKVFAGENLSVEGEGFSISNNIISSSQANNGLLLITKRADDYSNIITVHNIIASDLAPKIVLESSVEDMPNDETNIYVEMLGDIGEFTIEFYINESEIEVTTFNYICDDAEIIESDGMATITYDSIIEEDETVEIEICITTEYKSKTYCSTFTLILFAAQY